MAVAVSLRGPGRRRYVRAAVAAADKTTIINALKKKKKTTIIIVLMDRPTGKRVCPLGPLRIEGGASPRCPTKATVSYEPNARHASCLGISALPTPVFP